MQPNSSAGALRAAKLLIWVIPLLWIVNSVIARRANGVITPHVLAWGRWALAGAILAWVTRAELWRHRQELRTQARRYLLLGACGMWICGAAVYFAGQTTTMMNISLIYAASPVMIAVGSVLWLREPFSKRQALGVVLALVGGVLGCAIAFYWNGYTTATMGMETFSEIVFEFRVTPKLVVEGLVFAVIVGLIGTLFPAIRAARLPVILALKSI